MKRYLILIPKLAFTVLLIAVALASAAYLLAPVYDFEDPRPFEGDGIYNPYAGTDPGSARKAAFHFHTTHSDGGDAPQTIVGAYRDMGYEIVSPADHHIVTPAGVAEGDELRNYEHGLNAYRFHSVVFGADRPNHFLLTLWQGLSHRYETLRRLSADFPIVVLNHPATVRALTAGQVEQLSHYQYIEADRSMDSGSPLWDVALSAGHYSFVMANDDLHDLGRRNAIGRAVTFVMADTTGGPAVMEALRAGHTYAARVKQPPQNREEVYMPRPTRIDLSGDTLRVAFSDPARIRFIGQGGRTLASLPSDTTAQYVIAPDDTYVRVEAGFDIAGGTTLYLNPLARYSPPAERPANADYARIDRATTALSIAAHGMLALLALSLAFALWRRKKRRPDYRIYRA